MAVERVLGAIGIAFGVLLLTVLIPRHVTAVPGYVNPATFPKVAAWLFIGLGTIQLVAGGRTAHEANLRGMARLALVAVCLAATILAMPRIGYVPSAIGLMAAICAIMFERRVRWLAVTVLVVPAGTWVLFDILLGRPLPTFSLF